MLAAGVLVCSSAVALTATVAPDAAIDRAAAVPGQPGVPSPPAQLLNETFENRTSSAGSVQLNLYAGAGGMTYTADPNWLSRARCNGIVMDRTDPRLTGDCVTTNEANGAVAYNAATGIPEAIGQFHGDASPSANTALVEYTAGAAFANGQIMFQTGQPIAAAGPGRFISFSVVAAASNCGTGTNPAYSFFVVDGAGEHSISPTALGPCSAAGGVVYQGAQQNDATAAVRVARLAPSTAFLTTSADVGVRLRNLGATTGNDSGIDDLVVSDVTPQLDKTFSPTRVRTGGISTLTFTITNTTELGSKNGWSITDALPAGLRVASPNGATDTCDGAQTITAAAGGTSIQVAGGVLGVGDVSCTVSVNVTSSTPAPYQADVTYQNCPTTNATTVGLNPPNCDSVTFFDPYTPAGTPFQCSAQGSYLFQSPGVGQDSTAYDVDLVTGGYDTLGTWDAPINAMGFNPLDGFIYGLATPSQPMEVLRVNADGTTQSLGTPDFGGVSIGPAAFLDAVAAGDISPDGHLWIRETANPASWAEIDLVPGSPTYMRVLRAGSASPPSAAADGVVGLGNDIVYYNGILYSVGNRPANNNAKIIQRFDTVTGTYLPVIGLGPLNAPNGASSGNLNAGAAFLDADGYMYASFNASGQIWRIDLDAPVLNAAAVDFFAYGPASNQNDGARCSLSPLRSDFGDAPESYGTTLAVDGARHGAVLDANGAPTLTLGAAVTWEEDGLPSAAAALDADDAVTPRPIATNAGTYSLDVPFTNTTGAPATLSGWIDFNGDGAFDAAEAAVTTATTSGTARLTWTIPTLASFPETSYLRLRLGDNSAATASPTGAVANGEVEDYLVDFERFDLAVSKSVDPADGSPVEAGDTLTYTLTFVASGPDDAPADFTDAIAGLVDDADLIPGSLQADAPLTATAAADGASIRVSGSLPPGTYRVTYSVTVQPDGQRGDGLLQNFLVPTGTAPPTQCAVGDTRCTQNPVGELSASKSVDPADGGTVEPGDVLTYTLTLSSTGTGAVAVDRTDLLAGIVDDADLTAGPISSDPGVTATLAADGASIRVTGTIPAGQTVTVTYSATVRDADSDRGDDVLGNFLVETGQTPPASCPDGDTRCTANPVAQIIAFKSTIPPVGSDVQAGDTIGFTLHFRNVGAASGSVSKVDDLSRLVDDADLTTAPTVGVGDLAVGPIGPDNRFAVTGAVPAGAEFTVVYAVTVRADGARGDSVVVNTLLNPGDPTPPVCEPVDPAFPDCTVNTVSSLVVEKTATPPSGTAVLPGAPVVFTLTFVNAGGTPELVDRTDDLSRALDDATLTGAPTSGDPALTVTLAGDGQSFDVDGTVPAGQTIAVTYTLTVNADGARGDDLLENVLYPSVLPNPPFGQCGLNALIDCTSHPVPELTVTKTVAPASGTTVAAGDDLVYTITLASTGRASTEVDRTDLLAGVLDDAELTDGPTVSPVGPVTAAVVGDALQLSGTIPAGDAVTVTYTVTVRPDGQRGDDALANFVVPTGATPPTECIADDATCTANPVSALTVEKTAAPPAASTVLPGDVVTFAVAFTSTGTGDAPVDWTDALDGVIDDATLDPASISVDAPLAATLADDGASIRVTGSLPPGTATLTYSATVRVLDSTRGDESLVNFVVPTGSEPPATCASGEPSCTTHPIADLDAWKSADPASGASVRTGDAVTYTLHFRNDGTAPATVSKHDDLAGVLDDADLTIPPAAGVGDLAATPDADEQGFAVTGTVPAGAEYTVVYSVTVRDEATRGDDALLNWLLDPGEDPPGFCFGTGSEPICTAHPISELVVAKSVDPASGSVVTAGQAVTYSVTFTNLGSTAETIDYADDLGGVLDDAALVSPPSADDPSVLTTPGAGQTWVFTGTVAAGEVVTVSYSVQVGADGDRGDDVLGNTLRLSFFPPDAPCDGVLVLCTDNPVAALEVAKAAAPGDGASVEAGDEVSYTVTFTSTGAGDAPVDWTDALDGVIDDATLDPASISVDAPLTPALAADGASIRITGTLPAGATAALTYTVTVNADGARGDDALGNAVVPTGTTPPTTCSADDPTCTTHPVGSLVVEKTSSPADGSAVAAGDAVTYTVVFTSNGPGDVAVDRTDVLDGVIDDATLDPASVTAEAPLVAELAADGASIRATGLLPPGEATLTYTVTVNADGARGDDTLGNVVVPTGTTPPTTCATDDPTCTTHPVAALVATKSADPEDGAPVSAGRVLTHTLTFVSTGTAPVEVDRTDLLAGLVDDATLDPGSITATAPLVAELAADGASIRVTGLLPPGTAIVTYTSTVNADGERGDDVLGNFLVPTGTPPPPTCAADDLTCTSHLVAALEIAKTSDPADGATVAAGDLVTYTLTFTSTGTAAAALAATDDLAGVVDDAAFVGVVAASPELVVENTGNLVEFTGLLPPGVYTWSAQFRVADDGFRGDDVLANFVFPSGTAPPAACVAGDARCTSHPVAALEIVKSSDPPDGSAVEAGDTITYTVAFTSTGIGAAEVDRTDLLAGVVDDATLDPDSIAVDAPLTAVRSADGASIRITGSLPPGTATLTYTATVNDDGARNDDVLGNVVVATGATPPAECMPDDPVCTSHPVADLEVAKTAAPPSGTSVRAGEVLVFTVTFTSTGAAPAPVDRTDLLAGVVDDATLDPASVVVSAPLTAVPAADGASIRVTGTLPPGTATLTYAVTVNADSARGDDVLDNFVAATGDPPPATCADDDPACTSHPVGSYAVAKTADPADGASVQAGDTITYTLTFTSNGPGAAAVDTTDVLAGVVDDATLDPTSITATAPLVAALNAAGDAIAVTGALPPGSATVTYTVTVNADGVRGDGLLANAAIPTGGTPPSTCATDDAGCTEHPVGSLSLAKSSDPPTGSTVGVGDEIVYTLTFASNGPGAVRVAVSDRFAELADDAIVDLTVSGAGPLAVARSASGFDFTGVLPAGTVVAVSYRAIVDAGGDGRLENFLGPTGSPPPADCLPGSTLCTVQGLPDPYVVKSASPASGSAVAGGETIVYTLEFGNAGTGTASLAYEDDLSGVLDDADVVSEPVSSDPALLVGPIADGRFSVGGDLPGGSVVTVTYAIVVRDESELGDGILLNGVVDPGEDAAEVCAVAAGTEGLPAFASFAGPAPVGLIAAAAVIGPYDSETMPPGCTVHESPRDAVPPLEPPTSPPGGETTLPPGPTGSAPSRLSGTGVEAWIAIAAGIALIAAGGILVVRRRPRAARTGDR
ncbi:GEVED domain-containing protein [Agromyces seonyuensis]|uniref:DUF7927 domain-containing protein n=1 Tax=Agromyces seonyuensis TaxID=2662446 RepID=UPI001365886B|nr:GEVED domain-containing protein [Agromyces seonyuensis]